MATVTRRTVAFLVAPVLFVAALAVALLALPAMGLRVALNRPRS